MYITRTERWRADAMQCNASSEKVALVFPLSFSCTVSVTFFCDRKRASPGGGTRSTCFSLVLYLSAQPHVTQNTSSLIPLRYRRPFHVFHVFAYHAVNPHSKRQRVTTDFSNLSPFLGLDAPIRAKLKNKIKGCGRWVRVFRQAATGHHLLGAELLRRV